MSLNNEDIKSTLHIGGKVIVLKYSNFDEEIDLEQVTKINHSNLYGDAVTISALMNKIGILRAEAEEIQSSKKVARNIYESELKSSFRRQASSNGGKINFTDGNSIKLTESALSELVILDPTYQQKEAEYIEATKNYNIVDSLFWALKSKDQKLNNIVSGVTPEEFVNELIEGRVNGMFIQKRNSIVNM